MEGVNLSLSCHLDQVGTHIELIQPSKRPSPASSSLRKGLPEKARVSQLPGIF